MKKAVFLDRDGVINKMVLQENGIYDSPQAINQVELVEDIAKVINLLNKKGVPVIEVTNQPGVALGKMNWEVLEEIEGKVHFLLKQQGALVDKIYRCFHHPKSKDKKLKIMCDCRKPNPGLLLRAAKELSLDLSNSFFIGDNATDMEAGKAVGCNTILFFHSFDLAKKIAIKKASKYNFIVNSHRETISILMKVLK